MTLFELQKEVVTMIQKYGSDVIVTRPDNWCVKEINKLHHAIVDDKEFIMIE